MHAMQYQFSFPTGFDLQSVRDRVAEIGSRFDQLPGLHYKAFLLSEPAGDEPALYAPFYVWRRPEGMRAFLLSESFKAVCDKYGRPSVHQWVPLYQEDGDATGAPPLYATRELTRATEVTELAELALTESKRSLHLLAEPGAHSAFVGIDTVGWTLIRLTLWTSRPPPREGSHLFELAHLARPPRERQA